MSFSPPLDTSNIVEKTLEEMKSRPHAMLSEIIEKIITEEYPEENSGEIQEYVATIKTKIKDALNSYLQQCSDRAVTPIFTWSELDPDRLIGIMHKIAKQDNPEFYRSMQASIGMRDHLANDLTPREFELLCTQLLQLIGCTNVRTTQYSKDDGIDFLGILPYHKRTVPDMIDIRHRILGSSRVLILGQAKRYAIRKKVVANEIREFYGASQVAIRDYEFPGLGDMIKNSHYKVGDPILFIFATTSDYTRGARDTAKRIGMIILDGEQIVQSLASEMIGMKVEEEVVSFDPDLFRKWLNRG